MATALGDPSASDAERQAPAGSAGNAAPGPGEHGPAGTERKCAKCGLPLQATQAWCLNCGAAAPGSLASTTAGWRSVTAILAVATILVLGAAAAAYAALTEPSTPGQVTQTIAQVPAPVTSPPATATTPPPAAQTKTPGTPTTVKPLPKAAVKPPKIPLTPTTPKSSSTPQKTASTPAHTKSTGGAGTEPESQSSAITLDPDAASTYNPYNEPASNFGDPSLAIDGETSTGWTAQVEPSSAPTMTAGLAIDLHSGQRIAAVELVTSTTGMTVQVFGANGSAPPSSITDSHWVALSKSEVVHDKHLRIKLRDSSKAFRFLTLWISKAPSSSTPQAPGAVSVNELELFPAK